MKRISFLVAAALCVVPVAMSAQDAATQEQISKLNAQVEVLIEGQNAQQKRILALEKELSAVQQQARSGDTYASQEDVKQLKAALEQIDQKRQQDNEHIVKEIEKLGKNLSAPTPKPPKPTTSATSENPAPVTSGYEYTIQSGDTLSAIAKAYKEQKNLKVTVEQIIKANPGLDPKRMKEGQKIIIPTS